MKYYKLNKMDVDKYAYIEDFDSSPEIRKKSDFGVSLINETIPSISLARKNKLLPDLFIGGIICLIISNKFKEKLLAIEDSKYLEFLPVSISNRQVGKETYWLLNILENIPCFDWERSEYTMYPKEIFPELQDIPDSIEKLFFKEETIGNRHIFRMKEKASRVYISETLRKEIEKAGLTGVGFEPLKGRGEE